MIFIILHIVIQVDATQSLNNWEYLAVNMSKIQIFLVRLRRSKHRREV